MNTAVKVIVAAFVIIAVGFLSYQLVGQWHRKQMATAMNNQKEKCQQQVAQLEKKITELQGELDKIKEARKKSSPKPPKKALKNIFGEETQVENLGTEKDDCAMISQQTNALFDYFDRKGYLTKSGISMKFMPFFNECMKLLSEKPPVLVAEMDDLYLLAKNVSHIYGALGSQRLKILKTIMEEENDVLEPSMAVLYSWITACSQSEGAPKDLPELKTMYEYSGFFLNTLGGRSYLLRRDSKVRILVNFYSVLILDMANDEKLNSAGIDIRPYLEALFIDLSNHKGLVYRDRYLAELEPLQAKYEKK